MEKTNTFMRVIEILTKKAGMYVSGDIQEAVMQRNLFIENEVIVGRGTKTMNIFIFILRKPNARLGGLWLNIFANELTTNRNLHRKKMLSGSESSATEFVCLY